MVRARPNRDTRGLSIQFYRANMNFVPRLTQGAVCLFGLTNSALAVEGNAAAGPIGGTDIRQALLPPPGVYGGLVGVHATAQQFNDGSGHLFAPLNDLDLKKDLAGAFIVYNALPRPPGAG